jgi:hypothetical protein
MLIAFATLVAGLIGQPDTTVLLGQAERDLTGDGRAETLRVVGVGRTVDSLDLTFTIAADDSVIFSIRLAPLTRMVRFDAGRRLVTPREHQARLVEFAGWFFDSTKFMSPSAFVDDLQRATQGRVAEIPRVADRDRHSQERRHGSAIWEEIRTSPVTIFTFSAGGDALTAIGWSRHSRRFYRLLECC